LVVAKVRERLAVSKRAAQKVDTERFNDKRKGGGVKTVSGYNQKQVCSCRNLIGQWEHKRGWENIRKNIKVSAQESLGHCESKHRKQWCDEECSKLADRRKKAKLQGLQDQSDANEDNLSNVRREAGRHFRNKKREFLKDRINELESNSKNKNIKYCTGA
jgi:hypothetical protein